MLSTAAKDLFPEALQKSGWQPRHSITSKKKAIFIDGDFWHGRKYQETIDRLPKVYWKGKIARNVERDKINRTKLLNEGWKILEVWESDIIRKKTQKLEQEKIAKFLKT